MIVTGLTWPLYLPYEEGGLPAGRHAATDLSHRLRVQKGESS